MQSILIISQFSDDASYFWQAPIYTDDERTRHALELLSDLTWYEGSSFSFSTLEYTRAPNPTIETTALTIEWPLEQKEAINSSLNDMEYSYYIVPTKTENRAVWIFPLERPTNQLIAIRAAQMIAAYTDEPNITPDSYKPTHRFAFRSNSKIDFIDHDRLIDAERMTREGKGIPCGIKHLLGNSGQKDRSTASK